MESALPVCHHYSIKYFKLFQNLEFNTLYHTILHRTKMLLAETSQKVTVMSYTPKTKDNQSNLELGSKN